MGPLAFAWNLSRQIDEKNEESFSQMILGSVNFGQMSDTYKQIEGDIYEPTSRWTQKNINGRNIISTSYIILFLHIKPYINKNIG